MALEVCIKARGSLAVSEINLIQWALRARRRFQASTLHLTRLGMTVALRIEGPRAYDPPRSVSVCSEAPMSEVLVRAHEAIESAKERAGEKSPPGGGEKCGAGIKRLYGCESRR